MQPDGLESRSSAQRQADLLNWLNQALQHAKASTSYYRQTLASVPASGLARLEDLANIPVTRKADLSSQQSAHPPLGGMLAVPPTALRRIFQSPGPIYEPQGMAVDVFRTARALRAAGFVAGDLVHNSFSYHLSPGAWIMEGGLHALGCWVLPAGVGQTELQAQAMAQLSPVGYVGTPSFLKLILEKADELGYTVNSLSKAAVSGEALTPSMRSWFADRGLQSIRSVYATADLGMIAYEGADPSQGMIIDEEVILEIVEPGGTQPMPLGETGEVVVTHFGKDYPMIRFATGDLSAIDPQSLVQPSACGRTNLRIKGWLGRADQTTKVRGMFVHPGLVAAIAKRNPEIGKCRLVLSGKLGDDVMTLRCSLNDGISQGEALKAQIAQAVRDITRLRGEVAFVAPSSIPDDGKLIEDSRDYK
ncbi:MAG: phenylacetate--CoA ligase [Betaproteobacteria bacterium]|nr:phenylacetate--CoA ligase [Betaproteobacteria bacterium]